MAKRKPSKLTTYLQESGALSTKNAVLIDAETKRFWSDYRRKWQQEKRKTQTVIDVYYTQVEMKVVLNAAKKHQLSIRSMIKKASLAYLNQQFVIVNEQGTNAIKTTLRLIHTELSYALDEERITEAKALALLQKVENLEQVILRHLESPNMKQNDH